MNKYVVIIVVLILAIVGIIAFKSLNNNSSPEGIKEFKLDAKRFEYSPEVIEVNEGDTVRITINNLDTTHGIRIPEFDVRDEKSVEFTADKIGEFDFYCTVMCGSGHREMGGKIIVK